MLDYIVRAILIVLSLYLFGRYASILFEGCDRVLHVLVFEINPKFYVAIIILTALVLLLLAINMRRTDKEIERRSYVVYKTEEEYEAEKAYLTKKCLNELKKHPRYAEVRQEAMRKYKTAREDTTGERTFNAGSMFVYEESD